MSVDGNIVSGSSWIMAGFVTQAVTGLAFWVIAARTYGTDEVGTAAALFASVQFINYAMNLGLQEMLSRHHLVDRRTHGALWAIAVSAAVVASMVGGALYLFLVDPTGIDELEEFGFATIVFGLLCAGNALALLVDVACTVARRWRIVTLRMAATGLIRLPLALLPAPNPVAVRLLLANAGPIALSGLIGAVLVPGLSSTSFGPRFDATLWPAVRYAAVNYLSQLAHLAPQFLLPVIVLVNVSPTANAEFFIAWTFTMLVWVLPFTISRVLLAEAGHEDTSLNEEARKALVLAVGVATLAFGVGLIGRPLISWVFGVRYDGTLDLLPPLLAGAIPAAVATVLLGLARARDDARAAVAIPLVLASTTIGLALGWVPDDGASGAAWAWLFGNSAAALVAVVLVARRPAVAAITRVHERASAAPR